MGVRSQLSMSVYPCARTCTHTQTRAWMRPYAPVCVRTRAHTHMNIHTHTYTHTYMYGCGGGVTDPHNTCRGLRRVCDMYVQRIRSRERYVRAPTI